MKHANSEMIKAVLDNTELTILCEVVDHGNEDGNYWTVSNLSSLVSCFNKFFVCLPQHKEAVLYSLNGGVALYESPREEGEHALGQAEWRKDDWYMQYDCESRIKPKKEKRWIAVNGESVCFVNHEIMYPDDYQLIEIEVEV